MAGQGPEEKRKALKSGKEKTHVADMGETALEEAEKVMEAEKRLEEEIKQSAGEGASGKAKKTIIKKRRSNHYLKARAKVDQNKNYPLSEAIKLVKETSLSSFEGSCEIHIVAKDSLQGEIAFPYPTGKESRVVIADDQVLEQIKAGKIDFDLLIASPKMMVKIAPLAKILGPKRLMPNPKNGTISDNPEGVVKKLKGKTGYKTEKKAPLVHLVVGKVNQAEEQLRENVKKVLDTIGTGNIRKAIIKATMGPGIKINLEKLD